MEWVNALSTRPSLEAAVQEAADAAQQALSEPPDLGLVFISSAFASEYPRLMPLLRERLDVPTLIGCGGGGIVGSTPTDASTVEIEGGIALSLTLVSLPDVEVRSFFLPSDELPDLDSPPERWIEAVGVSPESDPLFIVLADPFMSRINDLLQGLDYAYPTASKVGGLSSSPGIRGANLFFNDRAVREGAVGVALSGNITLDSIVAQGCRPIGKPYRIAEGERNIILALDELGATESARPPLEVLRDSIVELSEADRELAQNSLFIGVVSDEFKQTLEPGDFLIRNLIGVDPQAGAVAIGDRVRPGQRVQFHLRDAKTSAEDLEALLEKYCRDAGSTARPFGALMFSCLGRGEGLYGEANFDSRLFHRYLDGVPLSGFFCNGEIGPVGGNTFLHGYTSVFGILRPASR
ncbi:FIST signal transduction protein [Baaleninema simplex]|uniref:FIST signal transduction protein n=1 Tax=Baaleninema simplex TaxID=2862350 RepID=UPI000346B242|nr:FIST N-terminal domain-containing protein [Baaleninema simplex]